MRIALASPPVSGRIDLALPWVARFLAEAQEAEADIVCFPEAFIPGLRGADFEVQEHDPKALEEALVKVRELARQHQTAVIMPMDWDGPEGILNVAFVISQSGELLGCQTKNQIAPEEDAHYVPGEGRMLFEINGVPFGIAICHEGWRYPETVRWAATRGAKVVFHPNMAGGQFSGQKVSRWGAEDSPYYEKAMVCRALENTIYFASVTYALEYQEAATAIISPEGQCLCHWPYGQPGLLVQDLDLDEASGFLAQRFAPERYKS